MCSAVLLVINVRAAKHLQKYLKPGKSCQSVNPNGAFQKHSLRCANVSQVVQGKVRPGATQTFQKTLTSTFRCCQPQKLDAGEQISVA